MLLLRAILKLPFGEHLARWLPQPVKMFLHTIHFYKQNKNMLLLSLRIRPFSKWGQKAWSLGTAPGGWGWGGDNPGAVDTDPEQGGGGGSEEGGSKRHVERWTQLRTDWMWECAPYAMSAPSRSITHPSLIFLEHKSNYFTFLSPGVPAAMCSGPSSVSWDLSLTAVSGHVVPAFRDEICTAPPPGMSSSA